MNAEEYRKVAESRNDRVIVDHVSYARGWLARNETAEKELAEARAEIKNLARYRQEQEKNDET
jgi:hypothetical protein